MARVDESSPFLSISIEVRGRGGFKSVLVLVAEATGSGAGAAAMGKFCGCIPVSSRSVLFNASSIWAFWVCWSANLISISASRVLVSSEMFSEVGEGNSGGVTASSLDDAPEKARSRKRDILAVGLREFRSRYVYLVLL